MRVIRPFARPVARTFAPATVVAAIALLASTAIALLASPAIAQPTTAPATAARFKPSPAAGFYLDYFARPSSGWRDLAVEEMTKLPPLRKDQAAAAVVDVWNAYKRSPEAIVRVAAAKNGFVVGANDEPLYYVLKTTGPVGTNGLSAAFIDLHGGGETHPSINDRDWRVHQERYTVPGKFVAVRAPRDTWDQFHNEYFHALMDRLVEQLILTENVDPNRVFLMGYSSGGYGVIQLAPGMPDRFAAAACNAAATEGSRPENLRDLPFWYGLGEKDDAYGRSTLAKETAAQIDALHAGDSDGYTLNFHWVAGAGHGFDDRACVDWMAQHTRDPFPSKLVWWQNQPGHGSSNPLRHQWYWLAIEPDVSRDDSGTKRIVATRNGQSIELTVEGYAKVRVRLNDAMLDLDQPVTVTINGTKVADAIVVPRRAETVLRTFTERNDPTYAFAAELVLDVPQPATRGAASTPVTPTDEAGAKVLPNANTLSARMTRLKPSTTAPAAQELQDCCVVDMDAAKAAAFMRYAATQPASHPTTSPVTEPTSRVTNVANSILDVDPDTRAARYDEFLRGLSFATAGTRAGELRDAIAGASPSDRANLAYLVGSMPAFDRETVPLSLLLNNSRFASEAATHAPWAREIDVSLFENYVLPYASFDERRDDWRPRLYEQLHERAWQFQRPLEAAKWINDAFAELFDVRYHATKRPKPDMSPFESFESKYASCTGLSILLVDACRSVGIPARVVGVPRWTQIDGNHNWVEVWDGQWWSIGDSGSDPRGDDWVKDRCRTQTDPDDWQHSVYALSWRETNTFFPVVWNPNQRSLPALNVTRFYSHRIEVPLEVPGDADATVRVYWAGELIVQKTGRGRIELPLASGSTFKVTITFADGREETQQLRT